MLKFVILIFLCVCMWKCVCLKISCRCHDTSKYFSTNILKPIAYSYLMTILFLYLREWSHIFYSLIPNIHILISPCSPKIILSTAFFFFLFIAGFNKGSHILVMYFQSVKHRAVSISFWCGLFFLHGTDIFEYTSRWDVLESASYSRCIWLFLHGVI